MSDEKNQTDPRQAKPTGQEPPAWTMPFPEMMTKMMAQCGCRPTQMSTMWVVCCSPSSEKKENQKTA